MDQANAVRPVTSGCEASEETGISLQLDAGSIRDYLGHVMKLVRLTVRNFTVFEDATFEFGPHVNVLIRGEWDGKVACAQALVRSVGVSASQRTKATLYGRRAAANPCSTRIPPTG